LFDITIPGRKPILGHLHPLTQIRREAEEVFTSMGFEIVSGPFVESEHYNFDSFCWVYYGGDSDGFGGSCNTQWYLQITMQETWWFGF